MAQINQDTINDEVLYTEYFTPVFRYFSLRTKNYDTAIDLTSSTFLKFLKQENKGTDKNHSIRLLFTIARTQIIDHWRYKKRHQSESIEENEEEYKSNDPDPQENFEKQGDIILVRTVLDSLDDQEKEIVTLRISSDMSYKDIAYSIGISSDNARQIYSRGLKKIKKLLEEKNINYDT